MPVISALMVFHRDTPFLRPAIASVLNQTLADLELVLVDNGTGLAATALGDLGQDPRVRWVRLPRNEGIPAGHNAGVTAARGEFLALLDYDDVALPRRFERQVERLRAEPALGLVSLLAETIDAEGNMSGREFSLVSREAQRAYVAYAAPVVTPAYTGRRELFARFPYRAEFPLAADFDFLARAIEATAAAAVPEVLLHYRRYPAQTTVEKAAAIEEQRCAIRLLAARRRAGADENFGSLAARLGIHATPAEHNVHWSQWALAEKRYSLAAYLARRALAQPHRVAQGVKVAGIALRAMAHAKTAERALAARLFFLGPVRALRLSPQVRDEFTRPAPPVASETTSRR